MSLITEKPAALKPENDLDNIPDDLLGPVPHMIRHANRDLFVMDEPPGDDDWIQVRYTFRAGDLIRKKPDSDGVVKWVRVMEFLGAQLITGPYTPAPDAAADAPPEDPAMFDRNGQIPDDEPGDGEPEEDEPTDSGLDEFNPAFSHNGSE